MLPLGRCSPRDTDQGNEQSLEVLEIFSCFVHGVLDGFLVGRFSFPILPRHITPRFPDGSTASSSSKRASSKARMSLRFAACGRYVSPHLTLNMEPVSPRFGSYISPQC